LPIEIDLALDMTILQIHQRNFSSADRWFSKISEIQATIDLSDSNAPRRSIQIDYYRGEFYFNQQKFIEAQKSYEKALQKAQDIGWNRAVTFLQIWLALVAIEVSKLDRAESLLEESFPSVNVNGDRRCLAFCKRAFALLKKAQGDWAGAKRWAASAREDFCQLLMRREVIEMDDFLSVKNF
jgi:LuxR family glucitol operon transcriptional activator